ncbi:hypothetical protein AN640_03580 [Candidatus Epulonipiscium fishelsonii]|uniref:Uncharacterized protein n=1 Tax=Candidatus Epulonipiscium fishelsonii TaxID=77094 RepID=A0ACC8XIV6_9FIRM|nr:hypothetical protein AN640_03580 [Epulopiscium sp. SCG-D08WGA-EpuloA1]
MSRIDIGGQAVIEGVMMKGPTKYAVAVRKPDKTIALDIKNSTSLLKKYKLLNLPILRGIIVFIESMIVGTKTLSYSAEFFDDGETEEVSKFEKWLEEKVGEKVLLAITMAISFILAISIFMILPMLLSQVFRLFIPSSFIQNLIEGFIRILIFLIYMKLISKISDIQRTFEYHGAEHKTINCLEQNKELTIENVKSCSRLHKSCGTSFLFIVMIVSILVFSLFTTQIIWVRTLTRIIMVPIVAGISYEFIRWARLKQDNIIAKFLSIPGMWLQNRFTTLEPDDKQIEVAIAAIKGVLDSE